MITRPDFDYGIDLLCATFNRRIQHDTKDAWFALIAGRFTRTTWAAACNATIAEEDTFPSNFVKAMLSRAPKKFQEETIPINPDTGKQFTPDEAHQNRKRLRALMLVMSMPKDYDRRKRILACSEASLRESDSPGIRAKWGAHIVPELDAFINESGI